MFKLIHLSACSVPSFQIIVEGRLAYASGLVNNKKILSAGGQSFIIFSPGWFGYENIK